VNETLGTHIRAARLGYRWVPSLNAYMRIADPPSSYGDGAFTVDLCPPFVVQTRGFGNGTKTQHRVWWEDIDKDGFPDQFIAHIRGVVAGDLPSVWLRRRVSFVADAAGRPIKVGLP